ncbi:MAG: glycosyltransferase family 4 protein [Candidatus Paceibacteria bacterium]
MKKKLLIITQVVDTKHPILGFFHGWIEEFAKQCEQVHVIALQVGIHNLPSNVTVHSLGKEAGESRLKYLWRFYRTIYTLRHEYDAVFVHMNQVYVILGGLLWRLWGKQIGLWYAHGAVSLSLRVATWLTHIVFTSTPQGFRIKSPKVVVTGQGIDMSRFRYVPRTEFSMLRLLVVGRIAESKGIKTLLEACHRLKESGIPFLFTIVGAATTETERQYEATLHEYCKNNGLESQVIWHGGVAQTELPALLAATDIFIHDGATNSLDKVLVEAVACGVPVISSNPSYRYIMGENEWPIFFPPRDSVSLATKITELANRSLFDKNEFTRATAAKVQQEHSLSNLIAKILDSY